MPVVLGSRSTDLRAGFGGCGGRALRAGDRLEHDRAPSAAAVPQCAGIAGEQPSRRPATPWRGCACCAGRVPEPAQTAAFRALLDGSFRVSRRSDRMGYRLEGGPRRLRRLTGAMITAPTDMGLVQVPPSGEPMLLMADRQTTGGYAAVAVVIAADLPLAGQLGPGHALQFVPCTARRGASRGRKMRRRDLRASRRHRSDEMAVIAELKHGSWRPSATRASRREVPLAPAHDVQGGRPGRPAVRAAIVAARSSVRSRWRAGSRRSRDGARRRVQRPRRRRRDSAVSCCARVAAP